ncbi:TetR family transcriptional regulator [Frondihabitans sp. PhB161]|nr:TetR family transcriptional regulator [Frondihabitans sp. PhB161]
MSTREIGRAAVRDELAAVGLQGFLESGFDAVTFDDLARRAGVSRSTYLRYFGSKEDVVLCVFDALGPQMAEALTDQASISDDWAALRHAVEPGVTLLTADAAFELSRLRLVWTTPSLWARLHEKQETWRPRLVELLAERRPESAVPIIALRTRVMAALGCLMVAYDAWIESDGLESLDDLLDQAFASLTGDDQE